jgi:cobalt-zinc-cadmium efflux system protein
MAHNHEHSHHHHHHEVNGKNLVITIILNVIITLSQIIGGLYSGSLALLSDALHNFSDVMALVIAWWANKISLRKRSHTKTFGYKRAQIIAALFNASVLSGIGVFLIFEAASKFLNPEVIDSNIVIYLAILSILLNFTSVMLVKADSAENLNMKAAYLHLLTDVMTSVAVLVGGLGMKYFGLFWIDSLISAMIAIYLIKSSFSLIKETTDILMQFSPEHINVNDIEKKVLEFKKVLNLHHLHIWKLTEKQVHLEAHIDFKENLSLLETTSIISMIEQKLKQHFGITHITLQAEFDKDDKKELIC